MRSQTTPGGGGGGRRGGGGGRPRRRGGAARRARGAASPAEAVLGLPEGGQQGLELGRGHAGEAPERSGATGQGLVSEHLATSTLPDRLHSQLAKGYSATTLFYLQDPHQSVRIRGTGDKAYELLCDNNSIGEIDPFHLLREAPRNGIYLHGGLRYRVKDVLEKQGKVRLTREYSPHFTTSAVRTSIRVRRLPVLCKHGQVVVGRATLDVNDYLLGVTEKHLSGEVVRSYPGAGMPNNWLPTEGTMLRLERPLWEKAVERLGEPSAKAGLGDYRRSSGACSRR